MVNDDYINKFFTEVGPKLEDRFDEEGEDNIPSFEEEEKGNRDKYTDDGKSGKGYQYH